MNTQLFLGPKGSGGGEKARLQRLLCPNKELDLDPAGGGEPWQHFEQDEDVIHLVLKLPLVSVQGRLGRLGQQELPAMAQEGAVST